MITSQEHTGFIKVEEYSLDAWLTEVETVIKQGYTFDFSSNETFPQAFGSMYTVVMVPVTNSNDSDATLGNPDDLSKALNLVQKDSSLDEKPTEPTPTKVDGRKKK